MISILKIGRKRQPLQEAVDRSLSCRLSPRFWPILCFGSTHWSPSCKNRPKKDGLPCV